MTSSLHLGLSIESRVLKIFLKNKFPVYKLVTKNFRTPFRYELDLVLLENENTLVFVEVRYRKVKNWLDGAAESVNWKKLKNLQVAAEYFFHRYPSYRKYSVRMDLVTVESQKTEGVKPNKCALEFKHIRNISFG